MWVIFAYLPSRQQKINVDPDPQHCIPSLSRGCSAHLRAGVEVAIVWLEVGGPVEPGGEPAAKVRQVLVSGLEKSRFFFNQPSGFFCFFGFFGFLWFFLYICREERVFRIFQFQEYF
jgi:hypothetical protein